MQGAVTEPIDIMPKINSYVSIEPALKVLNIALNGLRLLRYTSAIILVIFCREGVMQRP